MPIATFSFCCSALNYRNRQFAFAFAFKYFGNLRQFMNAHQNYNGGVGSGSWS